MTYSRNECLIWWLDQSATKNVMKRILELPEYLQKEIRSRLGRPGRLRLWVPEGFDPAPILKSEDADFAHLPPDAGGIVFHKNYLFLVETFQGIITDADLNIVSGGAIAILNSTIDEMELRETLEQMADERGYPDVSDHGVMLAMIEEEADFQLELYKETSDTIECLEEKVTNLDYALTLLRSALEIRKAGLKPIYLEKEEHESTS